MGTIGRNIIFLLRKRPYILLLADWGKDGANETTTKIVWAPSNIFLYVLHCPALFIARSCTCLNNNVNLASFTADTHSETCGSA